MPAADFPQELLYAICAHVYAASLPPKIPSLDPTLLRGDYGIPTSLPSSLPQPYWPQELVYKTLANLCHVNRAWYEAAKPWLWMKLEICQPADWLKLVERIAWNYEEETVDSVMAKTVEAATSAVMASAAASGQMHDEAKLRQCILDALAEPDGLELEPDSSVPFELLTPPASREPSPRRIRPKSKSPARWKLLRSINDAIQDVMQRRVPNMYIPTPHDPRPGRHVQHIDFNHFRTIGMRRSVEEGVLSPFVTGARVQAILKETPNLIAFGATEYMDGALTLPVLKELFLRGDLSCGRGRPSRHRGSDAEEDDRERRRECRELEAVDLTGCISGVFVDALTAFVNTHLLLAGDNSNDEDGSDSDGRARAGRLVHEEPLAFPGLKRLGLRGVKSIMPRILAPFVLAFPSLTHLDLSATRVTPDILYALGESPTVRLRSLALSRCTRLTGRSIRDLLVDSPVTCQLKELNLFGDKTFPLPLTEDELRDMLTLAPCFTSGKMVYLDLSSAVLTRELLLDVCPPQPHLRSLGLSYIPNLPLKAIAEFVKTKCSHVEVLTLIGTSPELSCGLRPEDEGNARLAARSSSIALHTHLIRPLCTPPFSFSLSSPAQAQPAQPATRLRVIELSPIMLASLNGGAGSWRIVRSKGGRGWYVDTASGWVAQGAESTLRRDLEPGHPIRGALEKLSDANGNVSSGTGWHARKMEILHGSGMLGREDGLYGAVSFAYQG
ncbi:hypothetical protein AX16_002379 [Volvariella volvacea WC 439]|nr:hypothetical protein AX16_002379 [Volvariella volvacea WC 439]